MKTMHHQSLFMSAISIFFGSATAIVTNPTPDYAKAFMLGICGGAGGYIIKLILDEIRKFIKK